MNESLKIAVDFDGTCVTHDYPKIGTSIGADIFLKKLADAGHKIILFTMWSGDSLEDAVSWFKVREIPLYGVNRDPDQDAWTSSPKAYANIYIDDAALGVPLTNYSGRPHRRMFVDWNKVEDMLKPLLDTKPRPYKNK